MHYDNVTSKHDHVGGRNVLFVSPGSCSVRDLARTVPEHCGDLQLLSPSILC